MLRALCLLLVCMNLGVAAWWRWHSEPVPIRMALTDSNIPTLHLLSESEPLPLVNQGERDATPDPLGAMPQCLSFGPFDTPADLRLGMNTLMPLVGRIQFREVAATSLEGYRVFLPAAGDRSQTLAIARALSARGVTDYYVVTAGDQQNTISLGLYRDLENARQRHDALLALGYKATIEARTELVPQWWIDVAAAEEFTWQGLFADPKILAVSAPCF